MSMIHTRGKRSTTVTQMLMRGAVIGGLTLAGLAVISASGPSLQASGAAQAPAAKKYVATRAITVDKATGELRKPTEEETQALVATLRALIKPAPEAGDQTTLASGAIAMKLDGQAAPVMLARPNADGTTEVLCVTSFEEAAAFLGLVEDVAKQ